MAKFGVKEVADVTLYDLVTGKPVLYLDSLKISNLENTAEESSATGGKGNAKLLTWDFGRTASFKVQDALLDPKALAALTGNALVVGVKEIHGKELVVGIAGASGTKTKFTLAKTPKTGTVSVFKVIDGDNLDTEVLSTVTVTTTDVEIDSTDIAIGAKAWIFYKYDSTASAMTFKISADKFPGYYKVVGDTVVRNEATGKDEPFQLVIYKAKLMPGFNLTLEASGDPTVFDFNMECYKDANGTDMVEMIKY
jgi:hypothetical protein